MIQPITGRAGTSISAAPNFTDLRLTAVVATAVLAGTPISVAGVFSNFRLSMASGGPGVGTTWTFTLQKNGSDTSVVITISGTTTSGSDTTHTVTLAAGDLLAWKYEATAGAPGGSLDGYSYEFNADAPNTYIFFSGIHTLNSVTPRFMGALSQVTNVTTSGAAVQDVCPVAGNITGYYVNTASAAGTTGTGYDLSIFKNTVKQDGSSGTPDTRVSITSTTLTAQASVTFSLPISPGDTLWLQSDRSGSASTKNGSFCVTIVTTNPNEIPLCGVSTSLSTSATEFIGFQSDAYGAAANDNSCKAYVNRAIELRNVYFLLSVAPASGKSRALTVQKNSSNSALTATISNTAVTANDAHKVKYAVGDFISVKDVPSTTPAASVVAFGILMAVDQTKGAGGSGNNGKKGGGGGLNVLNPGGASLIQIGNSGIDIGEAS